MYPESFTGRARLSLYSIVGSWKEEGHSRSSSIPVYYERGTGLNHLAFVCQPLEICTGAVNTGSPSTRVVVFSLAALRFFTSVTLLLVALSLLCPTAPTDLTYALALQTFACFFCALLLAWYSKSFQPAVWSVLWTATSVVVDVLLSTGLFRMVFDLCPIWVCQVTPLHNHKHHLQRTEFSLLATLFATLTAK